MLVLRRRPHEAIVFDGEVCLSVIELGERAVWLSFEAPELPEPVVIALPPSSADSLSLTVRSPASQTRQGDLTTVTLATGEARDDDAELRLVRKPGERMVVGGLALSVTSAEAKAQLELELESLKAPVTLSVVSLSPVDVRIGVDAPPELRVYRKEVWLELQAANTAAAGSWSEDDLASLTAKSPPQ